MKNIATLVSLILITILSYAQTNEGIAVKSYVGNDRIYLRWVPTSYDIWKQGAEYGYQVDRFLFKKGAFADSSIQLRVEKSWDILPMSLNQIGERAKTDDDFASLEGVLAGDSTAHYSRLEQINLQESRYGMALLLADFSSKLAKAQALYLADSIIPKDVMVGYKITLKNSSVEPAYILLNPEEKSGLPRIPYSIMVENGNVSLRWNVSLLSKHYVGYYVERSNSRQNFTRLNKTPYINADIVGQEEKNDIIYSDTTTTVGNTYYYRLVGVSPFGFEKVQSDTLMAIVDDYTVYEAKLRSGMPVNSMVGFSLDCPDSISAAVTSWELKKATNITGAYSTVSSSTDSKARSFIDRDFKETAYYQLIGLSNKRIAVKSQQLKVLLIDTIPPVSPIGLAGEVSRKGLAKFTWRVPEDGIKAYNIYRNYYLEEKPIPVSSTKDTAFSEQLQPGLSTKVYYYVEAVDERFNKSPLSKPLMMVVPDSIPPVPAIVRKAAKEDGGILLTLISSPSIDIDRYELCVQADSLVAIHQFGVQLPKSYKLDSKAIQKRDAIAIRTYDRSGNSSVSELFDISPFVDNTSSSPLAKVEVKRDKKVYHLLISNIRPDTRELKLYTSIDGSKLQLTKVLAATGPDPIVYTITDIEKVKSYRVMLVGALNVKPINVVVR